MCKIVLLHAILKASHFLVQCSWPSFRPAFPIALSKSPPAFTHTSPNTMSSPPAFTSSYAVADDDTYDFAAEHVTSSDGVSFITESAPLLAHHSTHDLDAENDEDDVDDNVFAPKTTYRDTHHAFASGPGHLVRLLAYCSVNLVAAPSTWR